jgi:two-component system response regulator HydG
MDRPQNQTAESPSGERIRLLIIDDDRGHAEAVAEGLERVGYDCAIATSGSAGARLIEAQDFDLVLTDLRMPDMDGMAILRKAKEEDPDAQVVVITAHGDVQSAVQALKAGAANYLQKPVSLTDLRTMVDRAADGLRQARTLRELRRQLDERFGFEGVIGNSPKMHEVLARLKAIAPTVATVLIQGETGTGKELVAKAIHTNSPRRNKNFVAMNCTALNENLLEDELFGHEAGAFTGADRLRKGRFEHAHGGTLFLDEVGDMPPSLQSKLLRVLENQEVYRIGSNEPIKVNVRLLSATNRDLEAAVSRGEFRQDLFFRLKVVTIKLPPLRERRKDLPLLTAHFVKEFNKRHGKNVSPAPAEPLRKSMEIYDWPGNVRELRNLIESAVVQDQDGILGMDDLQEGEGLRRLQPGDGVNAGPANLVGRPLNEVERFYIEQTLQLEGGNREEAARRLGIGERTLYRVIQDWKLQDRIRQALIETSGDVTRAAKLLEMKESLLVGKIKKWGLQPGAGNDNSPQRHRDTEKKGKEAE